jgi:predicted acyltransferase
MHTQDLTPGGTPSTEAGGSAAKPATAASDTSRFQFLDVLRGLTIASMILVNTSGDASHTYPILAHSRWNGCTFADVIFPCFLFMVGISGAISVTRRLQCGVGKGDIIRAALRRSAILFAFGIVVNGFPHFPMHTLRIFGVLQRIALCYLATTLLFLWFRTRTLIFLTISTLVGYWIILRWAPVPGIGVPGGTIPLLDPHANWPAWLDRHLLPARHLYHQGFYDPEGLLSTVPAIASTLIGSLTGVWLLRERNRGRAARGLLLASMLCLACGLACSHWLPFNKRLWTSSYVLWTGGIDLLALCIAYWLIDILRVTVRWFYPAVVFGTNALGVYIFSELFASLLGSIHVMAYGVSLQHWLYLPLAEAIRNPSIAALSYALLFVCVCFVPAWLLYRNQVFLKV